MNHNGLRRSVLSSRRLTLRALSIAMCAGTVGVLTRVPLRAAPESPALPPAAVVQRAPGLYDLAEGLVRHASYLLASEDRARAEELHRQLREEKRARERAGDDLENAPLSPSGTEFLQLMERAPSAVAVQLAADTVFLPDGKVIDAPGDVGALLVRLEVPAQQPTPRPLSCAYLEYDFAGETTRSTQPYEIPLEISAQGDTWALLTLDHVPAGRTALVVRLESGNRKTYLLSQVERRAPGRVKVRIVSKETRPSDATADAPSVVPAMVRMIWKTDGRARAPAGAIEFAARFDSQGSPTAERRARLPGRLSGSYWCVAEPFDMVVPAGDWEMTVRHGLEFVPLFDSFTVQAGETTELTYTLERWVDMPERGWYSGDDHVHFQILSDHDANALLAWLRAEDIHLANVVKMGDINRTWFEQRGWGDDYRVIADDHIISPGQECPRTHRQLGHTVHMNTTSMVRNTDEYYLYDRVFDEVHRQGGLVGYAHVDRNLFHVVRDMSMNVPRGKADFVEILQFGSMGTDTYYEFLNLGFPLTASAGSDVPWGGTVGEVRVYAYLGEEPFSAKAWFAAIQHGRTFVTNGPLLEFTIGDALPGDTIRSTEDRTLQLNARVWGHPERSLPRRLEVIQHGQVIAAVDASDRSQLELRMAREIRIENGSWIAVRAQGRDGSEAHTTPIYIVREPLRFWHHDSTPELIAARRRNLDEIEHIVEEARSDIAAEKHRHDRWIAQLARQGPELVERVNMARERYRQLEEAHAEEAKLRN